jgi:hypothetical protein
MTDVMRQARTQEPASRRRRTGGEAVSYYYATIPKADQAALRRKAIETAGRARGLTRDAMDVARRENAADLIFGYGYEGYDPQQRRTKEAIEESQTERAKSERAVQFRGGSDATSGDGGSVSASALLDSLDKFNESVKRRMEMSPGRLDAEGKPVNFDYWRGDNSGGIAPNQPIGFDEDGNEILWKHVVEQMNLVPKIDPETGEEKWVPRDALAGQGPAMLAVPGSGVWNEVTGQWEYKEVPFDVGISQLDLDEKLEIDDDVRSSWRDILTAAFDPQEYFETEPPDSGGGGRGGGGGGGGGVKYVAPDRRAVEEAVKNYVVAVTGTLHQSIVDAATEIYMKEARRGFKLRESQEVDPMQSVKEFVRGKDPYKAVHELRPESVDELDWVTGPQGKLRTLGLGAESAEFLGIAQAGVGASDDDLIDAAGTQKFGNTGRLLEVQRRELQRRASAVARLI